MKIIDWNPSKGDAYQGDVCLFRVPDDLVIDTEDEIAPRDNRLILASGEVTGHHHAIWLKYTQITHFHDEALAREIMATTEPTATARLYRDPDAVRALIEAGELSTDRLAIGFLIVEGGSQVLSHDEHDAIRIPAGRYYVGGQREWTADDERRVMD